MSYDKYGMRIAECGMLKKPIPQSAIRIPHLKKTSLPKKNMEILLIALVIGLFVAALFVNVYFRVKVLKSYKKLVQARVEFGAAHIFNRQKMEAEIFPRWPHMKTEIEQFVRHMQFSIQMASILIALITLFGAVLMYFRGA